MGIVIVCIVLSFWRGELGKPGSRIVLRSQRECVPKSGILRYSARIWLVALARFVKCAQRSRGAQDTLKRVGCGLEGSGFRD